MSFKKLTTVTATVLLITSPLAMAGNAPVRHSFSTDVTRSTDAGRSMHRHTEQTASQHQFRRESTLTTGNGNSAHRTVEGQYDADNQRYIRSVNGERLNGSTYAGERITQKTDNGYTRSASRTNANGDTATRSADVSVDRESNTVTKNITATNFQGDTHTATVTRTLTPTAPDGGSE